MKVKYKALLVIGLALSVALVLRLRVPSGDFVPVDYDDEVAEFQGTVKAEWIRDGSSRKFRLLEPVTYVASNGTIWKAEAGSIVDGASIPQPFWTILGAPTTGAYRDASVIHDVYCENKERNWEETHWVFRDACRECGLGPWKANLMYLAVFHYGPIWDTGGKLTRNIIEVDTETVMRMKDFCEKNPQISISELRNLDPRIWEDSK